MSYSNLGTVLVKTVTSISIGEGKREEMKIKDLTWLEVAEQDLTNWTCLKLSPDCC